ncbi:MAG TPA: beta-propeller domain-containing protein [Longimicrobium sp.]
MRPSLVLALAALLATGTRAAAQNPGAAAPERTLQPFRSVAELRSFVAELASARPKPAPAPAVSPNSTCPTPPAPTAARVTITGRVTGEDGKPLSGVQVRVACDAAAVTNGEGRYTLSASPGTRGVTASIVGRTTRHASVTVKTGEAVTLDFVMAAAPVALEGLVMAAGVQVITNNQHQGVDEGGIVKTHGDHLVILRRGRLFTVHVGNAELTPVSSVDVFGPGIDPEDGWYDEMLVSEDQVVVIGYNYGGGGTEIGLFGIDDAGRLRHRSTYHLRSDDYYSSRNYASRLVGDKLILYTPLDLPLDETEPADWLPALRRWHPGAQEGEFTPIATSTRVFRPARPLAGGVDAALHTVTTCNLRGTGMSCEATAVIGPSGSVFYVSPSAVYVWTTTSRRGDERRGESVLYRMPLDGSRPSALGVAGSPIDQFSFLESDDRHLNVLVRSDGGGARMWSAERGAGALALLRIPVADFGDGRQDATASRYRRLHGAGSGALQNRFVGNYLLYGVGNGWGDPRRARNAAVYVVPWARARTPVRRLSLPHAVDRIEAMGGDALVVGADAHDLHFTGVLLAAVPELGAGYTRRGAAQGETRSHGFFYRADGPENGVLGLPVRHGGEAGVEQLVEGSASIVFLANDGASLHELGELAAQPERAVEDDCVASCVDWYGNARPIFLRGRIFALMGYELVEGAMRGNRIREVRRTDFTPRRATASR